MPISTEYFNSIFSLVDIHTQPACAKIQACAKICQPNVSQLLKTIHLQLIERMRCETMAMLCEREMLLYYFLCSFCHADIPQFWVARAIAYSNDHYSDATKNQSTSANRLPFEYETSIKLHPTNANVSVIRIDNEIIYRYKIDQEDIGVITQYHAQCLALKKI